MDDIADRFAHTSGASAVKGNITITATDKKLVVDEDGKEQYIEIGDGNVNLYYGNKQEGLITTGGSLTVTGTGDVYVDSDLDIGGDLRLSSTGKDGEVLLTLTNIGKVQADKFTGVIENYLNGKDIANIDAAGLKQAIDAAYPGVEFTEAYAQRIVDALKNHAGNKASAVEALNNDIAVAYMHDFMHNFDHTVDTHNKIYLNAESGDAKLTVDMWDYENNQYDFTKYDTKFDDQGTSHTFVSELNNLDLHINDDTAGVHADASKVVFVEVSTGEQLKAIQQVGDAALGYNYALMGDINASDVENYVAIGTGNTDADGNEIGFTGTFDGRGNRVIGLKVNGSNAGIFSTVGEEGVVKNLNIYSGNFTGSTNAGAVAGVNNGRIENIVTFGNTVTANSNAGGIVGVNNSGEFSVTNEETKSTNGGVLENGIYDVESTGSVIAGSDSAIAGGLVGTNKGGLANSFSDSAVTVDTVVNPDNNNTVLGGVVGVNEGDVQMVDSLGVTNGGSTGSSNVGGIIGINNGNMYSGYNESIVSGSSNVGGIIGTNAGTYNEVDKKWESGTVSNVVNATSVTSDAADSKNVGGLVGTNTGSVTNGRNNGTITGTNYVGGLVGDNADKHSILTNLVNDSSAEILGEEYVGGIAGSNSGTITADEKNDNLVNRGSITGVQYVGGITGENKGTITNTNNDVELFVNTDKVTADKQAQYFGGVAGINQSGGTIEGATNTADVNADGANYVGGVAGKNEGTLTGFNGNYGNVTGASNVGGVIGENTTNINNIDAINDGTVTATAGGAGGIFGVHTGNITDSKLVNNKDVIGAGDGGTGGIATANSGKITNSILINEGNVSNATGDNVGGIFGIKDDINTNTVTITGSTLKNNGQVIGNDNVGGIFGSATQNVVIEKSSVINSVNGDVTGNSNVGGLIGSNAATIIGGRNETDKMQIAGQDTPYDVTDDVYENIDIDSYYKYQIYNNGTITVNGNGENIGGLFGVNSGEVEAAYNTGAINAGSSSNVGGIVGKNAGTVDQVFNTIMTADGQNTTISGGNNVGGLVGTNSGTLSNAYNTTAVKSTNSGVVGNAVGGNTGTITNIYASNTNGKLIGDAQGTISNAYSFSSDDAGSTVVKFVDDVDTDKDGIKDRVDKNSYTGFDFTDDWKNYDGSGNPLLKVFLTNLTVHDSVEINNEKVTLNEYLNLVYDAGEQDLNIADLIGKGFITAPNEDLLEAYKNTLKQDGNGLGESYLLDNTDGQIDAGDYKNNEWLYSNQIHSNTEGSFNPNNLGYDIAFEKNDGSLTVDKATINIDLKDIYHTYGDVDNVYSDKDRNNETSYENSYTISNWNELDKALQYYIKKYLEVQFNGDNAVNGDKTQSVGDYNWSLDFTLGGDKASNYQIGNGVNVNNVTTITGTDKSHVEKANLTITAGNAETMPGVMPNFTGKVEGLTNGDELKYEFGLSADNSNLINIDGEHKNVIGVWIGNTFYDLSKDINWAQMDSFFSNYEVSWTPGTLTVSSELLPDLPDNWPGNRWDYLFNDAPFDRNKNLRERKAEVNFVDGGMEI